MKKTKTPPPIKDADTIIKEYLSSCDTASTCKVFRLLLAGYIVMVDKDRDLKAKNLGYVDIRDENNKKSVVAIGTLLEDIANSFKDKNS